MAFGPGGKHILTGSKVKLDDLAAFVKSNPDGRTVLTEDIQVGLTIFEIKKKAVDDLLDLLKHLDDSETKKSFEEILANWKSVDPGSSIAGMARLWDVDNGKDTVIGLDSVTSVAFHPGGTSILLGRVAGTAELWNADPARLVQSFEHGNYP